MASARQAAAAERDAAANPQQLQGLSDLQGALAGLEYDLDNRQREPLAGKEGLKSEQLELQSAPGKPK